MSKYISDEEYEAFLKEIDEDNKARKAKQPQLVPDEVRHNIKIGFNPDIIRNDSWYLGASLKHHDLRYRESDPFAFMASQAAGNANKNQPIPEGKEAVGDIKFRSFPQVRLHITMEPGYEGEPIPAFHRCQLMDTENGAGALKTTGSQTCEDPEQLAKSMPGRNVGYTKNGIKPKCPVHHVTVTELGQCPICNERIVRRHSSSGAVSTYLLFEEVTVTYLGISYDAMNIIMDGYVKPDECNIYVKHDGLKTDIASLPWDNEWLQDEPIGKMNFVGAVNKKSDGRSPRTGEIGDPKSPLYMQQWRHTPALKLDYNVQYIDNDPQYTGLDVQVRKVQPELRECECGCKVHMTELRRGDKLCPQCGMVLGRVQVSQASSRGGEDDVEYGG